VAFDKTYYETNNYTNYLERGDRYQQTAAELLAHLKTMNLDHGPFLDFGCAVGFLLQGLKNLRPDAEMYGVDISEYAREVCKEKELTALPEVDFTKNHGVIFAMDVFEHMPIDQLDLFFNLIKAETIVFRMPVPAAEGEDYFLDVSRADPTHLIKWTKDEWREFFVENNYIPLDLNLSTVYNSTGVYTGLAIRVK
jgi:SAM-dependent methyltransferase